MSTLDIIILLCFLPAVFRGATKGFIIQAVSLVSIILGVWCAYHLSSQVCEWLRPYLAISEAALNVISFALILILTVLVLQIIGVVLTNLTKLVLLDWLNRILGVVFAIAQCALILGLIIIMFTTLNLNYELVDNKILEDSVCYQALKDLAYAVFPYLKRLLFNQ